jgi:hypothetical protein
MKSSVELMFERLGPHPNIMRFDGGRLNHSRARTLSSDDLSGEEGKPIQNGRESSLG